MGFLSSLLHRQHEPACILPASHEVIRTMMSVVGFDLTHTPDFASRVVPAINGAAEYYANQIAEIPGPFDVSAARFAHDPLVHALFPTRQDIGHGIGRSMDIMQPLAFLGGADCRDACALLGVRLRPDDQRAGAAPVFSDHTVRSLASDPEGTRVALRDAALLRIVTAFGEHLDQLRARGKLLREEWNIENRRQSEPGAGASQFVFAGEELLPENVLRGLVAWLQRPSEHLQVRVSEHRNEAGTAADAARQIRQLPVMVTKDRRQWTVCLVRFPVTEGIAAVRNESRQHRYIFI